MYTHKPSRMHENPTHPMEIDKLMLRESPTPHTQPRMKLILPKIPETINGDARSINGILNDSWSQSSGGGCSPSEPFKKLSMSVPTGESAETRLTWLRSQVVGGDAVFDSPFGGRRLTYADHTASGRCLRYVENFIMDNVLPFYGNTHTSDSHVGHWTTSMVHESSRYVKRCLGGGPDDMLLFCGSGSTGAIKRLQEVMGIAVPSILRQKLINIMSREERWVVFVGPYEHHSNLLSWRQSLAEVIEIGIDNKGLIDMEELRQKLRYCRNANRPILGSFSACSNVTGIYTDTRAIAKLLHEFQGFACFDFAASGPYAEIDMRSGEIDGYDAIFLSPHKFLGGPGSPGILLMSKVLYCLGSSPPSTCGGGTVNYVNGFNEKDTLYIEEIEERENGGTPQIIQITRAALAFWVKQYVGHRVIEKMEHQYIEEATKRLLKHQNIEILGNILASRQAILSFLIYSTTNSTPSGIDSHGKVSHGDLYMWGETGNTRDKPLHGAFVASLLNDLFGIQARAGCACAGPYGHTLLGVDKTHSLAIRSAIQKGYHGVKPGWTRVSFPYYMAEEEFHFILGALEFVANYAQRFLPLYHFNIRTGSWTFKKKALADLGSTQTLSLTGPISAKNMDISWSSKNIKHDQGSSTPTEILINEYASYFEQARHMAGLLPKFPPPKSLREDMDLDLLYFRI